MSDDATPMPEEYALLRFMYRPCSADNKWAGRSWMKALTRASRRMEPERPRSAMDEIFAAAFEKILRDLETSFLNIGSRFRRGDTIQFGVDMASGRDHGVAARVCEDGTLEWIDLKPVRTYTVDAKLEAEIAAAPEMSAEARDALQRHAAAIIDRMCRDALR